ncbi:hypothetical protein [Chamaesiphon minutus]|uniref:Uncharacterized protein n=1 Tax=Chamaesiphon minutus (strain ATCC 27169 / PCC 6605) TaxID=1173020 RepID=K9UFN7_CHAP6|nr:hypothetical protein [Chamaesiphon minutus]AFY93635.1 hypothetical protein Cha6605_2588 [Chamaesiphon minutus PCC 6605]
MGNHYANVTVYNVTQEKIVDYLSSLKRTAFISPTINKFTVIYDRDISADCNEKLFPVSQISNFFNCAVMAAYLHDSSEFGYKLYLNGESIDTYNSDCVENEAVSKYDKAKKITEIFECSDRLLAIDNILSKSSALSTETLINYLDNYDKFGVDI